VTLFSEYQYSNRHVFHAERDQQTSGAGLYIVANKLDCTGEK